MITITCDRCDRALEVDDTLAGKKYECPHCGDMNNVPAAAPEPDGPTDRAAARGLPSATGDEKRIMRVHPAMIRAHPLRGLAVVLLVLGGLTGVIWMTVEQRWILCGVFGLPLLGGLGWGIVWKLKSLSTTIEITNKRTIRNIGLLSKSTSEVSHGSIRNFQIDQSFIDRLFNVGCIGISSSGQDEIEIKVRDVPGPMRIREIIDAYR